MVLFGNVVTKVAERLFDPQRIHHMHATQFKVVISAGFNQCFKSVGCHVGRNVKFPTQLADIGDAMGAGETHAKFNGVSLTKWVVFV